MSELQQHPSYLELDRHCLGVLDNAGTAEHVRACRRCRDYVERYAPAEEVPAWVSAASRPGSLALRGLGRRRALASVAAVALAAAACFALFWPRAQPDEPYVGVKGAPSALVHVQRAGITSVWSGEPLAVGDKIRLEVMPEEFSYVSVFSWPPAKGAPVPLYAGRVEQRGTVLLPKAWQLDAAPGPEVLLIVFARAVVSAEAARQLLRAHDPREVAIVRFSLPKRGSL